MNEFLKTRAQVYAATHYLQENGLIESGISCKNWEIASIIPFLKDGDIVDLGSDGSVVIPNAVKLGLKGYKCGVDLAYKHETEQMDNDVTLIKGDLMDSGLVSGAFDIVTCLSVIEHEVKFDRIAKEVGRLLKVGGNAFISFDYWHPKPPTENTKLYNLSWNILDRNDVITLIDEFMDNGMELTSHVDWETQDAVINPAYCSPAPGVSYSFGILNFIKK